MAQGANEPVKQDEFETVYKAVVETARGRWFLDEFARRNRSADTVAVLNELKRMESATEESRLDLLRGELGELAETISNTREEIAAIKQPETSQTETNSADRIEAATGELDAIVTATEQATSDILSAAETIQSAVDEMRKSDVDGGICDQLEMEATNILMACSFQDITGQRTSKVVNTLRYLEQRVNAMVQIWGNKSPGKTNISADRYNPTDTRPDAHLLHGPSEGGVDQSAIDGVFSGDDSAFEALTADTSQPAAPEPDAQPSNAATDVAEDNSAAGPIGQDEIDNLFD